MRAASMARWAGPGPRFAGVLLLALACVALGAPAVAGASSDDRLALQAEDVPGLVPVAAGRGGVETLALELTATSQLSRVEASAFREGRGARASRLESRVFAFRTSGAARRSLAAWRKALGGTSIVSVPGAAAAAITKRQGKRSDLLVAFRRGSTVGLVRLRSPLDGAEARVAILADAALLSARLGRVAGRSAADRVAEAVRADGSIPVPALLQMAALTFGPVGGVTLPRGARDGAPFDATVVLEQLVAAAPALTPAQRAAVDRAIRGDVAPAEATLLDTPRRPRSGPAACPPTADGHPLDRALTTEALELRALIATQLGFSPTWTVCLYRYPTGVEEGAAAVTSTWSTSLSSTPVATGEIDRLRAPLVTWNECFVRVLPLYDAVPRQNQRFELAHEMYHCLHRDWAHGLLEPAQINAPWVEEAMANWAAHQVSPGSYEPHDQIPGVFIDRWFEEWRRPLFTFRYSAWGFFGLVEQVSGAPALWSRVIPMWQAGSSSTGAFAAAVGSNGPEVLNAWGPGLFRQPAFPRPWLQRLPILVPSTRDPALGKDLVPVGDDTVRLPTTGYRSALYTVTAGLKPVLNVTIDGHGHLTDGRTDWDRPHGVWLCYRDCSCPPRQRLRSSAPSWQTVASLYAALAAAGDTSTLTIEPHAMSEYCEPEPPAPPPGGDGGRGPGSATTHNDPHMLTYDGLGYDFQAAGEFVLARSSDGAFEVQARQRPVAPLRLATSNTAVAARVDGHRIALYGGDGLTLRIDGAVRALPQNTSLDVGPVHVRHDGPVYAVRWADGSELRIDGFRPDALRVTVQPAPGLAGQLEGVLGTNDGDPNDDLTTRGGERLPYTTLGGDVRVPMVRPGVDDFAWIHGVYADSWRVTRATSLFDYERGQSPASFVDRSVPRREMTLADFSAALRTQARRACAAVTQPWFRQACQRDVALTGDAGFATSARRAAADRNGWRLLEGFETRIGPLSSAAAADGTTVVAALGAVFGVETLATATVIPANDAPSAPLLLERGFVGDPVLHRTATGDVQATLPVTDVFGTGQAAIRTYSVGPTGAARGADVVTTPDRPRGGAPAASGAFGLLTAADWPTGLAILAGTGASAPGAPVPPDGTDCPAYAPNLAAAGGRVWLAFTAALCSRSGPRAAAIDPATGQAAAPAVAPGALADQLFPTTYRTALAVRPDGDGAIAYAGPGTVLVWHVGDAAPIEVGRTGQAVADTIGLTAEPTSGRLWVAWRDPATGNLNVRRSDANGRTFGPTRTLPPPLGPAEPDRRAGDWTLAAADGVLTVAFAIPGRSDRPGSAWYTRLKG